jgi:ferredoxin
VEVSVDPDFWEADTLCVAEAPKVFDPSDDEVVDFLLPEPPPENGIRRDGCGICLSKTGAADNLRLIRS